jgi:hypothetical protein
VADWGMHRYYFDMRIGDDLRHDEDGADLPDLQAVQREALRFLADMARDLIAFPVSMSVEVPDDIGPVMNAKVVFDIHRTVSPRSPLVPHVERVSNDTATSRPNWQKGTNHAGATSPNEQTELFCGCAVPSLEDSMMSAYEPMLSK